MKIWVLLFIFVFVQLGDSQFFLLAGALYPGDNISKSSEVEDLDCFEKESVVRNEVFEDVKAQHAVNLFHQTSYRMCVIHLGSKPVIKPVPCQYKPSARKTGVGDLQCAYYYEIPNEEARLQCIRKYCASAG